MHIPGIIITGTEDPGSDGHTAEVYDVTTGRQCTLPDIPENRKDSMLGRWSHTQVILKNYFEHL